MANPSFYKTLYRALRWTTLVALGVILGLALHKSPPPEVAYDPRRPCASSRSSPQPMKPKQPGNPRRCSWIAPS